VIAPRQRGRRAAPRGNDRPSRTPPADSPRTGALRPAPARADGEGPARRCARWGRKAASEVPVRRPPHPAGAREAPSLSV
jgi:hypothetical protein